MEIWKERIIDLLNKKGLKQSDLAKGIHKSDPAITSMFKDNKSINSNTLIDLSKFLGVSTDYILGLKDVETNDYKNMEISEITGLSVKALQNISQCRNCTKENYEIYLNELLESEYLETFLICLNQYFHKELKEELYKVETLEGEYAGFLPKGQYENLYLDTVSEIIKEMKKKI